MTIAGRENVSKFSCLDSNCDLIVVIHIFLNRDKFSETGTNSLKQGQIDVCTETKQEFQLNLLVLVSQLVVCRHINQLVTSHFDIQMPSTIS